MTKDFNEYLEQQKVRIGSVIDTCLRQFKAEDWQTVAMMGQEKYQNLLDI